VLIQPETNNKRSGTKSNHYWRDGNKGEQESQDGTVEAAQKSNTNRKLHAVRPAQANDVSTGDISGGSAEKGPTRSEGTSARDTGTGTATPVPLPEMVCMKKTAQSAPLDSKKCGVFEVVLHSREMTICPACARSPQRARLPAYARGIFAQS
jgi:hypothetical protein